MKKSMTRVLSLVLVLVMMLGIVPFASADTVAASTFTLSESSVNLEVGGNGHQISVASFTTSSGTNCLSSEVGATIEKSFSSSNTSVATVSDSGLITPVAAGSATITVTYTASNGTTDGAAWQHTHRGTATVSVTVTDPAPTPSAGDYAGTMFVGTSQTLAPSVTPAVEGNTWTLSGGEGKVSIEGMKITALAAGHATITATASTEGIPAVTYDITVTNEVTASLSADKVTVKVGEEASLPAISYSPELPSGVTPVVVWSSGNTDKATVDNDKDTVEGVAVGETTATANVEIDGYVVKSSSDLTVDVEVVSGDIALTCDNVDAYIGDSITLEPTLKVGGETATNVKYSFSDDNSRTSLTVASNESKATVTSNYDGQTKVTIDVKSYTLNGETVTASGENDIDPITVYVRFYDKVNVELTLIDGKTNIDFTDEEVFSKVVVDESTKNGLVDYSVRRIFEYLLPSDGAAYRVYFDGPSSASAGSLVDGWGSRITSSLWVNLSQVHFQQNGVRTGTSGFDYQIVDANGLTLVKGTCKITIAGGEGDIHYETTYRKAVALDAGDFEDFWDDCDLPSQYKLEYVKFDPSTLTGTLYTDSSKKTQVTSSMKFYLDPTSTQYDLDDVYYVPLSTRTTEYVDSMNFTAHDNYGAKTQYGTVTFGLNTTSTDITSRGVIFGKSYADDFADTYKSNTGKTLGYVVFELPKASQGKLYSSIPSSGGYTKVADGETLRATDRLWYDPSSTQLALKNAAFIPAAGFSGEVELSYTAYDENGNNTYSGILRLKVTTKTASAVFSDVTARSYSWAADSVDFLYYEGTAQGSNGKYNPKSNITRQDFMLMLYRAFLADDYDTFVVSSNFPDVVKGTSDYSREIYQAVGVAKYLGIAQGTNDRFNPKSNITRQEAMVLIYRTLDTINKDLDYTSGVKATSFKDYSKISSWATTAISNLVSHGVILGTNDYINPSNNITRAEMACILHRVLTY